jgi:cytochrome c-type biogenesis protein CcmH
MVLWITFAVMTAAAIFAVLWPLGRKARTLRTGSDVAVYRDQLDEIDRDRAAGLIGEAEAAAARVEVSRRLLAAADAQGPSATPTDATGGGPLRRRRAAAVAALVILPLLPVSLYLALGSPDVPDQPASARIQTPQGGQSIASLVGQVEAHLASNPNDGPGWEVLAPVYMRLGRFDDAVAAWRKALALNGVSAVRESNLGEALVAAANGVVTTEAKAVFQKAAEQDSHEPKAQYFLGLAAEQDGNREGAAAIWRAIIANAPPGAPWVEFVRVALARVTGEPVASATGPNADDIAAAANMNDEQRAEMIHTMVARLSDRLHKEGDDVEGWLRLVRAYIVLGDRDKAKDAAADARRALSGDPDKIKRIDDLVKNLGIEG